MTGPMHKALTGWGSDMPDWIEALVAACANSSQNKVAQKLGRSAAVVSQVLGNSYPGDMAGIEARVRGVFMNGTITCPELGEMNAMECQQWQVKARRFGNANMLRVRMFRACNRCPVFRKEAP